MVSRDVNHPQSSNYLRTTLLIYFLSCLLTYLFIYLRNMISEYRFWSFVFCLSTCYTLSVEKQLICKGFGGFDCIDIQESSTDCKGVNI